MKRILLSTLVILSLTFFNSCSVADSKTEPESFSIETDKYLYVINGKLTAEVNFKNHLGKSVDIRVCGGSPMFTLQAYEDDIWMNKNGTTCVAIPIPSKTLENNNVFKFNISFPVDTLTNEKYRFKFVIYEVGTNNMVSDNYLVSNSFEILN